jgi:hypothetical protein
MSPDVLMQSMPPMQAYSDQGAQMIAGAPEGSGGADPSAFAKSELDKIAASLMNVAKVVSQSRKELMPLVQKMAEAGSMLSNELQTANPPGGMPPEGSPAGPPQAETPGQMGLGA